MPAGFRERVLRECPSLRAPFRPAWWLPTGLLQTVGAVALHRTPRRGALRREVVAVHSGGHVGVDWLDAPRAGTAVVFLPGAGPPHDNLVSVLMAEVHARLGCACALVVYQCLDGLPPTSHKVPCSAYCATDDLTTVFAHVRARCPRAALVVVAGSMGTALFANWAARHPAAHAALRVGPALLLAFGHSVRETVDAIDAYTLCGTPLSAFVLRAWKRAARRAAHPAGTVRAWDEACAGAYGYARADDLYADADVRTVGFPDVPSLLVNADDDMVTPAARVRGAAYDGLAHVARARTARGGHLGWIDGAARAGSPAAHAAWIARVAVDFVRCAARWEEEEEATACRARSKL